MEGKMGRIVKKVIAGILCVMILVQGGILTELKVVKAKVSSMKGIDVSSHNGVVDWEKVADKGYEFAMIRSGLGMEPEDDFYKDVDTQFERNYEEAGKAGLKVGVYHDCGARTAERAILEAKYCIKILNNRELDYPVAYDMEKAGTFAGGKANTTEIAKAFCKEIEKAGYTPMIYSSASHLENDFDFSKLKGIKVWVAHYDVEKPAYSGNYDIWQYTQNGNVEGANTNNGKGGCDENYSFMTAESVKFLKDTVTLGIGESYLSNISLKPKGCTDSIKWTSSDKKVATVSKNGTIEAVKSGKTVITVKTGSGKKDTMIVIVKKAPKTVKLSWSKKTMKIGTKYQLKPILTANSASNKISYFSSKKSVVSVDKNGMLHAKKKGQAMITIKTFNDKMVSGIVVVK